MTATDDIGTYGPHPGILDAEAAVAGAAMTSARCADAAAEILTADDFYDLRHALVFTAACDLSGSGAHVDEIAVRNHLVRTGAIKSFGPDASKLFDLVHVAALGGPAGVQHHAELVRTDAIRRRVQIACTRGAAIAGHPTFEIEHINRVLDDIQNAIPAQRTDRPLWIGDDLDEFLDSLTRPADDSILTSPWPDLDERVMMRTGQLVVVGARPGGGKSLFGLQVACHTAIANRTPTLIASMEMPRPEVDRRIFAAQANVLLDHLEKRHLDEDEWDRIQAAAERIRHSPLVIDDQTGVTLAHLRARLRWMARTNPARLVVVDYVQLMTATRKAERRDLEIGEFTRGLKLLAMELDLCVIALAQLNRGPEQRLNKKPQMSDLRESGSIENDADIVLFTHPEPENSEGNKRLGEIDLLVRKNRSGPNDIDIPLAFQGHYARFKPMASWAS